MKRSDDGDGIPLNIQKNTELSSYNYIHVISPDRARGICMDVVSGNDGDVDVL